MSKFNVGDVVRAKNSVGSDWTHRVVFTVDIAGKPYCGLVRADRTGADNYSEFDEFMEYAEKGSRHLSASLTPEESLQIYREPVVVAMTGDQYDRFLGAHGFPDPDDLGGYKTADLREHDDL